MSKCTDPVFAKLTKQDCIDSLHVLYFVSFGLAIALGVMGTLATQKLLGIL